MRSRSRAQVVLPAARRGSRQGPPVGIAVATLPLATETRSRRGRRAFWAPSGRDRELHADLCDSCSSQTKQAPIKAELTGDYYRRSETEHAQASDLMDGPLLLRPPGSSGPDPVIESATVTRMLMFLQLVVRRSENAGVRSRSSALSPWNDQGSHAGVRLDCRNGGRAGVAAQEASALQLANSRVAVGLCSQSVRVVRRTDAIKERPREALAIVR
jgi:hypothetical protein